LGDTKGQSTLHKRALGIGRHIFGGHFTFPIAQTRDARALYGKWIGVLAKGGARSAPASPQPSSVAAQPASDIFATLEKLAELHGKGILSNEEFASKKAELLGRL
jgi:hypothetical protein